MTKQVHVLLADDDDDDRYFFDMAIGTSSTSFEFTKVEDGEQLMDYLAKHHDHLPDVLFLDLNMPRKNGAECLIEIKSNKILKHLPVIIYSTSLHGDMADLLYNSGAHSYLKKGGLAELETTLHNVLISIEENTFARPLRNKFILNVTTA